MQKLMPRKPSASGHQILSLNAALALPLYTASFISMGFCGGIPKLRQMTYTYTTTIRHPHPINQTSNRFSTAVSSLGVAELPDSCFRSCGCFAENNGRFVPLRSSVVSMERRNSGLVVAHRLWFATQAGNNGTGDYLVAVEGNEENETDNVKTRSPRRQRSGTGDYLVAVEGNEENETDNVKTRSPRRQRSGTGGCGAVVGSPDLLTIPGVGPRNLKKLVEKGFEGVSQLKQLYKDKFFGKSNENMVEYLQSSVGIIHKNHAESITMFIKESVDEDLKLNDGKPFQKKRITLCVEGNISVGKTTFLRRIANETLELRDLVEIVPEPIDKWQDIGPDHFNILNAFYAEPERYAYTFQNYVFVTRVMQEKESSGGIKPLRLMERSVFSDRMVFVRAVHEAKWMNEMEISIYDSWFDPVVSTLPGLIPDGFIYLRASPCTCHRRMMLRKRSEEGGVSLDYLRDLHEKHESWLFPFQSGNQCVLSVSKLPNDVDWSLHPNIRDRVFYLDGDHMHSSIRKVPALVLDCEPDIDFSRDVEAKEEYGRQVAEFFEFVKNKKEVLPSDNGEDAAKANLSQVLLPHHGKLWLPGTPPIPDSALKSLDFRRAMSFMSQ